MVCELLPREKSLQVYQHWFMYGKADWRSKAGDSTVDELKSFFRVLLDLMGFPVERLDIFNLQVCGMNRYF